MKYFQAVKNICQETDLVFLKKTPQITSCADFRGIIKEFINFEFLDFSFPIG